MNKNKDVKFFGLFIIILSTTLIAWEIYSPFYAMNYRESVGLPAIAGNKSLTEYFVGRIDFIYLLLVLIFGVVIGIIYYMTGNTQKEPCKLTRLAMKFNFIAIVVFVIGMLVIFFITQPEIPILDPITLITFFIPGCLYFVGFILTIINFIQNKMKNSQLG